jgi:hypothetical protein
MSHFASEQEVYDTLGKLFLDMLEDDELMADFRSSDTIVQYQLREPAARITVKLKAGEEPRVDLGTTELEPEVVMSMDADTAHAFWLGNVNITVALARGQIKAQGPIAKMLKLVPAAKPVFARYRAQLEDQGRQDLIEVA